MQAWDPRGDAKWGLRVKTRHCAMKLLAVMGANVPAMWKRPIVRRDVRRMCCDAASVRCDYVNSGAGPRYAGDALVHTFVIGRREVGKGTEGLGKDQRGLTTASLDSFLDSRL